MESSCLTIEKIIEKEENKNKKKRKKRQCTTLLRTSDNEWLDTITNKQHIWNSLHNNSQRKPEKSAQLNEQ